MSGLIRYIKIARIDNNGVDNTLPLESLNTLVLPSGSSFKEYTILNRTRTNDYFLYYVQPPDREDIADDDKSVLNYGFTGSCLAGTNVASTFAIYQGGISIPITESNSDNLRFYNADDDAYKFQSYPSSEIINVRFSGSITTNGSSGTTVIGISQGNTTRDDGSIVRSNLFTPTANASAGATTSFDIQVSIPANTISAGDYLFPLVVPPDPGDTNSFIFNGAKFFISSSLTNTNNFKNLIIEPYLTSKFYGEDCDVLQNNATQGIPNTLLQKVDYSTNAMNPVNFEALISGTATNADIPQSYFEVSSILNPSYNRSIVQSSDVNVYNPLGFRGQTITDFGDPINVGNLGQTPSVSSLDNVIVEFNWAGGTNPEIPNGGSFKLSNLLFEVTSADQIKTITPIDSLTNFELITNIYSASTTPNITRSIFENRGDYYQILNNSYGPGKEIVPFIYAPEGTPTLPAFTKVLDTTIEVPSVSSFAGTSSYGGGGGLGGAYGVYGATTNLIVLYAASEITKLGTNYSTDTVLSISTSRSQFMDIIVNGLKNGNRWFITLINNFEFPVSITDADQRFTGVQDGSELNKVGVFEILGMDMDVSNNVAIYTDKTLGSTGYTLGSDELGFLIWKSPEVNKSRAVIVSDTTSGVTAGAFYSRYPTIAVTENFETITKEFGANQTG